MEKKMKRIVFKFGTALAMAVAIFAATKSYAGNTTYRGSCSMSAPLTSYDRCDRHSYYGYSAYDCAVNEALAACEEAGNLDCVEVSVRFQQFISKEFPGFKGCTSNVTVRGWKE